jgi:prolyl-tRNA synthetase
VGIPLRIVIGGKGLKEGQVEVKWRHVAAPVKVPIENAMLAVQKMLADRRREEAAAVPA